MIGYSQLYHLNLSSLYFAVDEFLVLTRKFKSMDSSCGTDVAAPFDRSGWKSSDMTSMMARAQVAAMRKEFGEALHETKSIHTILSDAHDELKKYRERLKHLADVEAKAKHLAVDGNGTVRSTADLDAEGVRNDPDAEAAARKQDEAVEAFQDRVDKVVMDAGYAEETFARALRSAVRGKEGEAFNGRAPSSVDSYEASRASALLKKFDRNEKLSDKDRLELEQTMLRNQRDPEFSRMTLDRLGPDRTLLVADELAQTRGDHDVPKAERQQYAAVERALANSVGAANKDKEYSEKWRARMKERGTEKLGEDSYNSDGYQALAGLLARGSDPAPAHLTSGLLDDMIDAEKKNPGLWDEHQTVTSGGDPDPQRVQDPVDDMLRTMSRNPGAATSYLDPHGDHPKRLEYLLDDRDWPDIEVRKQTLGGEPYGEDRADATNTRAGLGAAIEAATRGETPGTALERGEHSESQARILRDTVHLLDEGPQKEEVPENMRRPLANALADYTADTHEILGGVNGNYKDSSGQVEDGVYTDDKGVAHAAPRSDELIRVMRGISEDEQAYATMHRAETAYVSETMDKLPDDAGAGDVRTPARDGAAALGSYDAIRDDLAYDKRDDDNAAEDWNAKVRYHLIGGPVTPVPVVGDGAQRLVDVWTADMANDNKTENEEKTAAEIAEKSMRSQNQMGFLVEEWAEQRGIGRNNDDIDDLEHDLRNDRNTGREEANKALGRD